MVILGAWGAVMEMAQKWLLQRGHARAARARGRARARGAGVSSCERPGALAANPPAVRGRAIRARGR